MSQIMLLPRLMRRVSTRLLDNSKVAFVLAALLLPWGAPSQAQIQPGRQQRLADLDVRDGLSSSPAALAPRIGVRSATARAVVAEIEQGKRELATRLPSVHVEMDEVLGVPKTVRNPRGLLTGKTPGQSPEDVVRSFVSKNSRAFGLSAYRFSDHVKTDASYKNPENEMRWVRLKQEIGGVPVFGGELRAATNQKGELVALTNQMAAGLDGEEAVQSPGSLSAEDALLAAARHLGYQLERAELLRQSQDVTQGPIKFEPTLQISTLGAEQVLFPLAPGDAVLAWQVVISSAGEAYILVVDANTGDILWRKDARQNQTLPATYEFYEAASPVPGLPAPAFPDTVMPATPVMGPEAARTTRTVISELTDFDPLQYWIADNYNSTRGSNAWAGRDQVPPEGIDPDSATPSLFANPYGNYNGPSPNKRNFVYSTGSPKDWKPAPVGTYGPQWPLAIDSTKVKTNEPYNSGSVTNMFFWVNRFHDFTYRLGFSEQARNFQENNFGRGGRQEDLILAEAQEYDNLDQTTSTFLSNDAYFLTLPDGFAGTMGMGVFPDNCPYAAYDSDLDQTRMLHELTHGMSNRLIGNAFGLKYTQGKALNEGWSDFYALSLVTHFSGVLDPARNYPFAAWLSTRLNGHIFDNYYYGMRRYPYSMNFNANPFTWGSADPLTYEANRIDAYPQESALCLSMSGIVESHALGELWAEFLWHARGAVMQSFKNNGDPDGWKNGNVHMMQLVNDGQKITPDNPTFIEARNAILDVATAQDSNPKTFTSKDAANPSQGALDELTLWQAFAQRGLGASAVAPDGRDGHASNSQVPSYYAVQKQMATAYPNDPGSRAASESYDLTGILVDDSIAVFTFNSALGTPAITAGKDVKALAFTLGTNDKAALYGRTYDTFCVGSNGYVFFGSPRGDSSDTTSILVQEDTWQTVNHFDRPRISGCFADLDPAAGGSIILDRYCNRIVVTYIDVPVKDTLADDGVSSAVVNFQIEFGLMSGNMAGAVRITYGNDCKASWAIAGLSRGQGKNMTTNPPREVDLSKQEVCDYDPYNNWSDLSEFYYSESPFDLQGLSLYFWPARTQNDSWSKRPVEAFDLPVTCYQPVVLSEGGTISPGDTVELRIPFANQFRVANLSPVVARLYSGDGYSPGPAQVIVPEVFYDKVVPGQTATGISAPFKIMVPSTLPCGAEIPVTVEFESGQTGLSSDYSTPLLRKTFKLKLSNSITAPVQSVSWPSVRPTGTLGAPATATDTELRIVSETGLMGHMLLKNTRTLEIVQANSYDVLTHVMGVTRGASRTLAAPMLAGDVLEYVAVPIPNSASVGSSLGTIVDGITTVGLAKVAVKIEHSRLGDLTVKLSCPDPATGTAKVVTLLDRLPEGTALSNTSGTLDVVFSDDAMTRIQSLDGSVANSLDSGLAYKPAQPLSSLIGTTPATTWTLTVSDNFAQFNGQLDSWSLTLRDYQEPCGSTSLMQSVFANSAQGWNSILGGDTQHQSAYYVQQGSPALVLHTDPAQALRVPAWQSPGVPYNPAPNQVYRFNAWVARSGQTNMSDQSQMPNMRMRVQVRYAMANIAEWFFDPTQFDPSTNYIMKALSPSTDPLHPTHYHVDFDPTDVPALTSGTIEEVKGMIENYSIYPNEQGDLIVTESNIERYSAPSEEEGVLLRTYSGLDFAQGSVTAVNYANTDPMSDSPNPRPRVTTDTLGVKLDSSMIPNHGASYVSYDFVPASGTEPLIKPGKMYRVRYHVVSSTRADNNPQVRLRARTMKFSYTNKLELGSAKAAGATNNLIASQALPGLGTLNPLRKGSETLGGYYDQYFDTPPALPAQDDLRRLRFGIDLVDGVPPVSTDSQSQVSGNFYLDEIQVHEFDQIP